MKQETGRYEPYNYFQLMEVSLRELLVEKGIVTEDAIAGAMATMRARGPERGAAMVARAWRDPGYKARLLANGSGAAEELGFEVPGLKLIVVENTASTHNVIVCTLCSCYPRMLLGIPPEWYKSRPYRSRVVREPRKVLAEFGTRIAAKVQIRVHDSNADMRYMVLPMRPAGTDGWDEPRLAALVTRDCLLGTALPKLPRKTKTQEVLMTAKLFAPIQLGGITLSNRVVVSPMCQYSAADGAMSDWHLAHLGSLAVSRAGLAIIEATGVTREGRISHGCTGLYNDLNEAAMARAVQIYRGITSAPIGVQLAHAGRKASTHVPWQGGKALGPDESPWQTVAPSALPYAEGWHTPHELTADGIRGLADAFAASAARALRMGLDLVELHSAHGYLLHEFLSPNSNKRSDRYGGSLENRMRAPLEIARALRESWPKERALGARITSSEWAPGGFEPQDAVAYARELKKLGFDYVCVSSGGNVPQQKIKVVPGYQVAFAETVKRGAQMPVMAVGMIVEPQQAEDILAAGQADMVALARGLLDDPRWVWHAAERFGVKLDYPPQYRRAHPEQWPGAELARPKQTA